MYLRETTPYSIMIQRFLCEIEQFFKKYSFSTTGGPQHRGTDVKERLDVDVDLVAGRGPRSRQIFARMSFRRSPADGALAAARGRGRGGRSHSSGGRGQLADERRARPVRDQQRAVAHVGSVVDCRPRFAGSR